MTGGDASKIASHGLATTSIAYGALVTWSALSPVATGVFAALSVGAQYTPRKAVKKHKGKVDTVHSQAKHKQHRRNREEFFFLDFDFYCGSESGPRSFGPIN